jgi:hypothetical protein
MPYIQSEKRRTALERRANALGNDCGNGGELNFALTKVVLAYLGAPDSLAPAGYEDYAEILATLEAVKLEFYRRALAPYEHDMMVKHGDVYPVREPAI